MHWRDEMIRMNFILKYFRNIFGGNGSGDLSYVSFNLLELNVKLEKHRMAASKQAM